MIRANPNTVELIDTWGGDEKHACSAWTSTNRELTPEKRVRIPALLKDLAFRDRQSWEDPRHTSPFEKSALQFLVRTDKATHVHIIKHRIGVSVNAESARYKELKEDDYLYPDDWPTESDASEAEPDVGLRTAAFMIRREYQTVMATSLAAYHVLVTQVTDWKTEKAIAPGRYAGQSAQDMTELEASARKVARKRAKETARLVLPHASQLISDVLFNFLSFMHFMSLRAHPHAQREIRLVAAQMMLLVCAHTPAFDASFDAFGWTRAKRGALYAELGIAG